MRVSTYRDDALGRHDATSLREALASGEVAAEEVRAAARARAEDAHLLNAVVTWLQPEPTDPDGEFAGVPTFIKDNEDIAGYPTSFGSRATPTTPLDHDSRLVRDWRRLGFATLGKSALPEFGLTATTEPLAHGPTRNPWGLDHTTGGSSGGSAALVAAGVVPLAHANDGGGSIRIPASCCGLVGLKPSRGRLVAPEAMDRLPVKIVTQGVVTRSVRDTVAFYEAMARVRPTDLPPIGPTSDPARLRIGMLTTGIAGLGIHPEVLAGVEKAARQCEELGHAVEPIDNPFSDQIGQDFLRYWGMLAFSLQRFGGQLFGKEYQPQLLEPFSVHLSKFFSSVAVQLPGSLRRLRRFPAEYDAALGDYDLLLSPTLGAPPVEIGYISPDTDPREHLVRLLRFAGFTALQNVSGAPGISLPLARSAAGLPIGIHFAARVGQEQMLLDLASALEQAVGWPRVDQA
jgi:amidase